MNRLTPQTLRRFVPIIKIVITIAVVIGLFVAARTGLSQWNEQTQIIQQQLDRLDRKIGVADSAQRVELEAERSRVDASVPRLANVRWHSVLLAALLYACGLVPSAFVLRSAMATMGESPRISTCVAAQLIGHVGKYVPGKAMVIVLRVGALARDGVGPMSATISVFMETFLMMAVGAAVSGAIIYGLPVPTWMTWGAASVAIAASIPTIPPVMRRVVAMGTAEKQERQRNQSHGLVFSSWARFFFVGWGCSLLTWGLIGASFAVLVSSIPSAFEMPPAFTLFAVATAAIGLAMVVGFASLLPGGAGIRELVLTTVMATSVGATHAILSAVAARLLFIGVEATLALVSWLWLRRAQLTKT